MLSTKNIVDHPGFNPGGVRDRLDNRDFQFGKEELGHAIAPFDWNKGYDIEQVVGAAIGDKNFRTINKDQGQAGSCGGEAWSYYAAALEAVFSTTYEERSARYVYAQTFVPPNGGTFGRDNAELYKNQGIARESVFTSYMNGNPPTEDFMRRAVDITPAIRADARLNMSLAYANVAPNIDLFAQALRDNYGLVLGIDGENNGTWLSSFPVPPKGKDVWGHWLYVGKAKLINGKKFIGVHNSWGNDVGEDGWQWIGEDYFNSGHIWYGWTHVFNLASIPTTYKHTFNKELDYSMRNQEVLALQTGLQVLGFFPAGITPTNYYGAITRTAVEKYQVARNIVTGGTPGSTGYGRVGKLTIAALNKDFK